MARSSMSWLITRVLGLIRDTDNTYFTDEQVQDVLDEDRYQTDRHLLTYNRGRTLYSSSFRDLEGIVTESDGGWSGGTIINIYADRGRSSDTVTPDTWDLRSGTFGFTTAQTDSWYYLEAWVYDPYLAASKLCEQLVLESTITPGVGETGGAIVGRFDYERMSQRFLKRTKFVPVPMRRIRYNRTARL
ncbi:MAG: hypothetical protein ACW99U_18315 [Candidatus Thorarchaeota archaeon]|jgi:hypothetical protein